MAAYIAMRVEMGKMNYNKIFSFSMYQRFKNDTDAILTSDGYTIGDNGYAVKSSTTETTTV
jgi:hypothetical protein